MYHLEHEHIPLVYCQESGAVLVFHHMLVMLLSQQGSPLVYMYMYVWFNTSPYFIYSWLCSRDVFLLKYYGTVVENKFNVLCLVVFKRYICVYLTCPAMHASCLLYLALTKPKYVFITQVREIEGLSHLSHLRVLNLAGNDISCVANLSGLQALAELNLRRNRITSMVSYVQCTWMSRVHVLHLLVPGFFLLLSWVLKSGCLEMKLMLCGDPAWR